MRSLSFMIIEAAKERRDGAIARAEKNYQMSLDLSRALRSVDAPSDSAIIGLPISEWGLGWQIAVHSPDEARILAFALMELAEADTEQVFLKTLGFADCEGVKDVELTPAKRMGNIGSPKIVSGAKVQCQKKTTYVPKTEWVCDA